MLYNPPSGSTDANAGYIGKIIAAGQQGSKIPPAVPEYTQREIVAAIAAAGLAPTNSVLVQLAIALSRGVFVGNLTGSGDLAVATLGIVFPALLQGMRIGGVATAANTTTAPKLRIVGLGTQAGYLDFPIILEDGSQPAVGAITAGRRYRYEADGAGNVVITGGGLGSGPGAVTNVLNQKSIIGGRVKVFTSTSTEYWQLWSDCSNIEALAYGPGGGGSGQENSAGAGGGFAWGVYPVTGGQYLAGTCGVPGTGNAGGSGVNGGNGTTTSLMLGSTALCSATGGGGGNAGPSTGGMGYGGNIANFQGGPGEDLVSTNAYAAGGSCPLGGGASTGAACFPGGGGGAASNDANAGVPNRGWNGAAGLIIVRG